MVAKTIQLPNIRKFFVPSTNYTIADADLAGADAQVVAWEADDPTLKQMFRERVDVHSENAKLLGVPRPMAKRWVHGTNYGGSARTMAMSCGLTTKESERMQDIYFGAHPGILQWHERTMQSLIESRSVSNKFGYRIVYFDRIERLLPEALAWVPQSTVAIVTVKGALQLEEQCPWVKLLLQVHDSLVFQYPRNLTWRLKEIHDTLQVTIPYDDPLTIPWGLATSDKSWGDVEKTPWK